MDNDIIDRMASDMGIFRYTCEDDNTYYYVGNATKMYGSVTSGYIILRDNVAYIISGIGYGPNGDILTFVGNTGSTTDINNAKAFTIADLSEMIYGTGN